MRRSWLRLFWAGVIVVGAGLVYLVWSGIGGRLLHQEIETQLGRLLSGEVSIARVEVHWADGLSVEAHGFQAYPNSDPTKPPALRASRVLARLDFVALLIGRLELSTLVLEGSQLRLEQAADGSFPDLPLPAADLAEDGPTTLAERSARQIESLDPVATAFLEDFRVADRIEVIDGALSWIDHGEAIDGKTAPEIRLELISGHAERNWLSDEVTVEARAVFVDGLHAPFPIEIAVHRDQTPDFEWLVSCSDIPLALSDSTLVSIESIDKITGKLDATLRLTTSGSGSRVLDFEATVKDAIIVRPNVRTDIRQERIELVMRIDLDPRRLRIAEGRLQGPRLTTHFKSSIARPLREASRARLESRMVGIEIDDIRALTNRLKDQGDLVVALSRLTDRIEEGSIRYIETAGTAEVRGWQDLLAGRRRELPDGFLFGGAVDDVTIGTGSEEQIEDLSGELEWIGDQISLRRMNGVYNGVALPEMTAVIQGASHLIRSPDSERVLVGNFGPVPGIFPLLEIFKPRDPDSPPPVKAIGLAIDRLDHPILRWPIRDARVLIEPLQNGMEAHVREGRWSGTSVSGDFVWLSDDDKGTIDAHFVIGPPPIPAAEESENGHDPAASKPAHAFRADRWGEGRFEIEFRPRPTLPFRRGTGFFRLDGSNLFGNEVEITLEPQGKAALRAEIDLLEPESIGLDLSFAITDATMAGMSEFVVLPPDLVTGGVGATGSLAGRVRPDTSFVAELDGRFRVEAVDGRIAMALPVMLRLGKASEGYNPFANADALEYESLATTIQMTHGVLETDDFEIEGPLRVFAKARLDTNLGPPDIRAVVGIFLFRSGGEILGTFPLVRSFLPGSDRGLIGAYFEVEGPADEPDVDALPLKTLMSSVPNAIKAPFKVLGYLFGRSGGDS